MGTPAWVTGLLCPTIGVIICNIMWLASFSVIKHARAVKDLGALNPMPFLVMIFNCTGWTIYSVQKRDYFIFFGNCTGLTIGFFYSLTALRLLGRKDTAQSALMTQFVEGVIVFCVGFWCIMGLIAGIIYSHSDEDQRQATTFIGVLCDFASISYYAAPLSTMTEVIRRRDASSLYAPAIIMNFINAFMWFIYGLTATKDILLWGPNGLGMLLAISQLFLVFIFSKGRLFEALTGRNHSSTDSSNETTKTLSSDPVSHMDSIKKSSHKSRKLAAGDEENRYDAVINNPLH